MSRKQTREEFFQREKQRQEYSPWHTNKVLRQTKKDYDEKAPFKHPKALYKECIQESGYWHQYAAQDELDADGLGMILCKDLGCQINYCSLLKMSLPSQHNLDDDCSQHIKNFNDCMLREKRKWIYREDRMISMYDYIQKELAAKRALGRHKLFFLEEASKMRQTVQEKEKDLPPLKQTMVAAPEVMVEKPVVVERKMEEEKKVMESRRGLN